VNIVLGALLPGLQAVLGDQFVGMYLTGSLAAGEFDRHSDVDFVVITEDEVGGERFSALAMMHRRVALIDSWCATQLDGGYISRRALRRFDPANAMHPHIDRGRGERLKMVQYDEGLFSHTFSGNEASHWKVPIRGLSSTRLRPHACATRCHECWIAGLHAFSTNLR